MRWLSHLLVALVVGVILVILWEIYFGASISTTVMEFAGNYGVGISLLVGILILLVIGLWWKTSRG